MDTAIESKEQPQPVAQRPRQVHTITDRFSMANTYVIDDGQLVVVDPGSELNVQQLLTYLRDFLRRDPGEIDLVALTHLHPDHTAGLRMLRQASRAPVAASIVARWLAQSDTDETQREGRNLAEIVSGTSVFVGNMFSQVRLSGTLHRLDNVSSNYQRQAELVDLWIEDVHGLPGHPDWRVIASPGHTPDSLCFYNPFSYELICGDTLITLDGGAILVRGGTNRHKLQQTLQTLQSLKVYYLYPGHGRPILAQRALARIEW
ncbi:MAG TPA: MBL fold metallo-hydrolase [Ktedonobacteraceae bacterium]|nr:MBL fold metallo-hydrolase [Ktedonobacteraceae bacterium]